MKHRPQTTFLSHGYNLVYIIALISNITMKVAHGFPFFEGSKYHLCMMNEMAKDTLYLSCNKSVNPDGGLTIPPHTSFNWSFHGLPFSRVRSYYCDAHWGTINRGGALHHFGVFVDTKVFLDRDCEGRHCIWKFTEDGIYLFQLHKRVYQLRYDWEHFKPSMGVHL